MCLELLFIELINLNEILFSDFVILFLTTILVITNNKRFSQYYI